MSVTDKRVDVWLDALTYEKLSGLARKHGLSINETIVRCVRDQPTNSVQEPDSEPGRCKHCRATILLGYTSCSDCTSRLEFTTEQALKGGGI